MGNSSSDERNSVDDAGLQYPLQLVGYRKPILPEIDLMHLAEELINLPGGNEILVCVGVATLKARNSMMMEGHQLSTISRTGFDGISGIYFNPMFPFLTPLRLNGPSFFRKEGYCFMYYLLDLHCMALTFTLWDLRCLLYNLYEKENYLCHYIRFFELFMHIHEWVDMVEKIIGEGHSFGVLVLGRQFHEQHVTGRIVYTFEWIHFCDNDFFDEYKNNHSAHRWFRKRMLELNGLEVDRYVHLLSATVFDDKDYPSEYRAKVADATINYADRHAFGFIRHSSDENISERDLHYSNGNDSDPTID